MTQPESFGVDGDGAGRRLDAWLAAVAGLSRGEAQSLIERGLVTVGGLPAPKSRKLVAGETVQVRRTVVDVVEDTSAPFGIAFEDDHLAVVIKPPGVVVHPAPGNLSGTLVEALGTRMPLAPAAGPGRPGIVHRLDKDTSGLMVVAKTDEAYEGLVTAMGGRAIARTYLALVAGSFALPAGRIEAPMGRSPRERTRMGVVSSGRDAVTEFKVLEPFDSSTLLEVHLGTGRTHQIRVHLAHIHRPVVGDAVYGKPANALARQLGLTRPFLHSHRMQFVHPVTGADVDVTEPLPADLQDVLALLESSR